MAVIATVCMVPLGPWAATVLSGGQIDVSAWLALAFGALLVGQAVHLPANVLLTRPNEARWQALWTLAMAAISIGLGCVAAARFGAVGVVYASALAIFAAQVLPDLLWVPRLVRRRPRARGLSTVANGATTVTPGPTSCITVALAPTVAPSCNVIGPITTAPAPTRTRSPSVGLPVALCPMVTCWLIQQWLPMDSAVTMVATPCWMKSPGPIRSALRVRVAAGR